MANRFATVDTTTSPWDAHITKGRLEAEGIPVFIAHEHHIALNWMYSTALGGVKLQVASGHAARAREVLESIQSGECRQALRDQFADLDDNACPQCGSEAFGSLFPLKTIASILILFFGFGIVYPARREWHTCRQCGRQWSY